jgi:hypothetical protein
MLKKSVLDFFKAVRRERGFAGLPGQFQNEIAPSVSSGKAKTRFRRDRQRKTAERNFYL